MNSREATIVAQISFAIFSEQQECGEAFARLIGDSPHATVSTIVSDAESLQDALGKTDVDAVLADLGYAPHLVIDLLESALPKRIPLFVSGSQEDSQVVIRAFKMGACEYFSMSPDASEIASAIDKLLLKPTESRPTREHAPILAVMGAKGGVGSTLVACQLAATLQRLSGPTAVVDLNCPLGDVALHLDLNPRYTLASVLGERDDFDATYLHSVLARHASGLQVLAAPERVEESKLVSDQVVERALTLLRADLAWVVVDVARSWDDASVRALDLADEIVLVTSLDVASLDHTRKHVDLLRRIGHADHKIHLVPNRRTGSDSVTAKDFEAFLGRKYEIALPNDYAHAAEALNTGRTLSDLCPGEPLTLAFEELAITAHEWCGLSIPDFAKTRSLSNRIRQIFRRK
jgi:pilus assembly protein CpaE